MLNLMCSGGATKCPLGPIFKICSSTVNPSTAESDHLWHSPYNLQLTLSDRWLMKSKRIVISRTQSWHDSNSCEKCGHQWCKLTFRSHLHRIITTICHINISAQILLLQEKKKTEPPSVADTSPSGATWATGTCSAIFCCWLRVNLVGAGGVGGSFPHSSSSSFS